MPGFEQFQDEPKEGVAFSFVSDLVVPRNRRFIQFGDNAIRTELVGEPVQVYTDRIRVLDESRVTTDGEGGVQPGFIYAKELLTDDHQKILYVDTESAEAYRTHVGYIQEGVLEAAISRLVEWAPDVYIAKSSPDAKPVGLRVRTLPKLAKIVQNSPKDWNPNKYNLYNRLTFTGTEKDQFQAFYEAVAATQRQV